MPVPVKHTVTYCSSQSRLYTYIVKLLPFLSPTHLYLAYPTLSFYVVEGSVVPCWAGRT